MTTFQGLELTPLSMYEVETPPDIRRAVLYVRVSDTAAGMGSVEDQETVLREVCEARGWPVHPKVFGDPNIGASRQARKTKGRRKEFEDLLETLGPNDILMTVADNRAHRNAETYVEIRKVCAEVGAYWYYGGQVYDMNNGRDRVRTLQDASRSEGMIEDMLLAADRGRRRAAIDGKPSGRLQFGYIDVSIKGRRGSTPKVTEDGRAIYRDAHPYEAPIVQELFQRIADHDKLNAVLRDFEKRQLLDPPLLRETALNILRNPAYAGVRVFRKKAVAVGKWTPLVSEEIFLTVQKNLSGNSRSGCGSPPAHLLTGIAWCGNCKTRRVARGKATKGGKDNYICKRGYNGRNHLARRVDFVDSIVEFELLSAVSDSNLIGRILNSAPDYSEVDRLMKEIKDEEQYVEKYRLSAADRTQGVSPQMVAMVERTSGAKIDRWYEQVYVIREAIKSRNPFVDMALSSDPVAYWESRSLEGKREIIKRTLRVTILPSKGVENDPDCISVEWIDTLQNDEEAAV